jgi:hypothetical protein
MSAITLDDIAQELTVLSNRLDAVESRLTTVNGSDVAATFDLANVMADVREITQDLFPGKCEFTSEFDPEYPDDRYVVVNVEATGDPKEIVDRCSQWHRRIRKLSSGLFRNLRLSVVPI